MVKKQQASTEMLCKHTAGLQ